MTIANEVTHSPQNAVQIMRSTSVQATAVSQRTNQWEINSSKRNLSSETQSKKNTARENISDLYHRLMNRTNLAGLGKLIWTLRA